MTTCLSPNGPMVHKDGDPNRLFVATIDGVVLLERPAAGSTWRKAGRWLEGLHISALLHEPESGDLYASTHGDGIRRSQDGGRTWTDISAGLTKPNIFSLAATRRDGRVRLLAGSEPVSLFVSEDRGDTWVEEEAIGQMPGREKWTFPPPPHHAHVKSIGLDPADPDVLYGCIEQGALMKSEDSGRSWREITSYFKDTDKWYRDIHKLVALESDPRRLLMTTGMGLYRSEDAGDTWTQLTDLDFDIRYPDHLIVAPDDEDTLYLSGAGQSPDAWRATREAGATVRISRDGGRTWARGDQGLGPTDRPAIEAMSMAIHQGGHTLFLGNTDGDIYERGGDAEGWTCIWRGLSPVSKVGHYKPVQRQAPQPAAGPAA